MEIKIKEFERQHGVKRDDIIAFIKKMPGRSNDKVNKNTILKDFEVQALMTEFVSKKVDSGSMPSGAPLSSSLSATSLAALQSASAKIVPQNTPSQVYVSTPEPSPAPTPASTSVTPTKDVPAVDSKKVATTIVSKESKSDDDTLLEAEILYEEIAKNFEAEKAEKVPLDREDKKIHDQAVKKGDLKLYFQYLTTANEQINGLKKKYSDEYKSKVNALKDAEDAIKEKRDKLDHDIVAFEERKATLEPTLTALDKREKAVSLREMAVANERYPEIILSLTKTMEQAQKEVLEGSHQWLGELSAKSKEYQELLKGIAGKRIELTQKENELTEKEEEVSAREEFVSIQEETLRQDVTEDMEFKYGKKIEKL